MKFMLQIDGQKLVDNNIIALKGENYGKNVI